MTNLGSVSIATSVNHTHNYDNYGSWIAKDHDGTTYTVTSGDTLWFKEGSGIDVNFTADDELTISHADTSSQGSVNNSNGTVIQDVTLDGFGHVTGLASTNLDTRYTLLDNIRYLALTAFTAGGGSNSSITTAALISEMEADGAFDSYSSVFKTSWSYAGNDDLTDAGRFTETAGTSWITWTDNSNDTTRGNITALAIAPNTGGSAGRVFIYNDQGSGYNPGWREVWTSMSDGSGSGLDADLLDGQDGSYYYSPGNPPPYDNYSSWTAEDGDGTTYTVTSGDTLKFAEGGAIDVNFTADDVLTISHADTSSQASVNNSGGTVIQDITLDTYGHITGIASVNLNDTHTHAASQITGGVLGYSGRIGLSYHPEAGGLFIPGVDNDLSYVTQKGGSVSYYYTSDTTYTAQTLTNTGSVGFSTTVPFNGKTNYSSSSISSVNDVVICDIEMPFSLSYGNTWYVDFGATAWRAKNVSFYAYQTSDNAETTYKLVGGAITNNGN